MDRRDLSSGEEEWVPEASLLSISIRRRVTGMAPPHTSLLAAWEDARRSGDPLTRDAVRLRLGAPWQDCFDLRHCEERRRFLMAPVAGQPRQLAALLEKGEDLAVLSDRINHIATRHCHRQEAVADQPLYDDGPEVLLTLVPLVAQDGIVTHYLGTLRQ